MRHASSDGRGHVCLECGECYKDLARHEATCVRVCAPCSPSESRRSPCDPQVDTVGASAELLDDVAGDLCDLRHQRGLDEVDIRHIKAAVNGWNDLANDIRAERLQPFLRPGVSLDAVKEILSVDMFDGLATSKQEFAWAKRNMPYIEPRVVNVGGKDEVISFNVASLLQRMLVHNAGFRKTCEDRSREWKKGEQWQVTPDTDNVLDDFDKAVGARFHEELMRPATEEEKHDLRVPLLFNCDDIEVVRILLPLIV